MTPAIGYASPSDPRLSPPDVPEYDQAEAIERLMESPTFCEEAIGNAARDLYVAYKDDEYLPARIYDVIEKYAQFVIERAINLRGSLREGEACERVIHGYTKYDGRQAA